MAKAFVRDLRHVGMPRITIETLDGNVYAAAMFRESPTVAQGIEIICNASQNWLPVRERKSEFDQIVTHGGTFHEVER